MPVEERALRYLAKAGDGSMRDALSLLDQCAAFHFGETLTYEHVLDVLGAVDHQVFRELFQAIRKDDVKGCIQTLEEMVIQGRELSQFCRGFYLVPAEPSPNKNSGGRRRAFRHVGG